MITELDALESKISQVVLVCNLLRTENLALAERLAAAEQEKKTLTDKMESARLRIEKLAMLLPADLNPE